MQSANTPHMNKAISIRSLKPNKRYSDSAGEKNMNWSKMSKIRMRVSLQRVTCKISLHRL